MAPQLLPEFVVTPDPSETLDAITKNILSDSKQSTKRPDSRTPLHPAESSRSNQTQFAASLEHSPDEIKSIQRVQSEGLNILDRNSIFGNGDQEIEHGIQRRRSSRYLPGRLSRAHTVGLTCKENKKATPVDLGSQITKKMKEMGCFGLGNPHFCLPDDELIKLMNIEDIRNSLSEKLEDKVMDFVTKNPKVLAITLLIHRNKEDRTKAMTEFQNYGFTDGDLANMKDISSKDLCVIGIGGEEAHDPEDSECEHLEKWDAFHSKPWCETTFEDFLRKRWSFLVPMFAEEIFEYHFDDNVILPFKQLDKTAMEDDGGPSSGTGNFGEVKRLVMLAKHQTAIKNGKDTIMVALKELKKLSGEDNLKDWKREVNALRVFNKLNGRHIVRGIGAFVQHSRSYILMEWADQGDLRGIWTKNPTPHLEIDASRVGEVLEQFRGLADALHKMHERGIMSDSANNNLVLPKDRKNKSRNAEAQSAAENWRHGDLKPDNILSFRSNSPLKLGILKIADLGRAKQQMDNTAVRVGTTEVFSTFAYDSPEVHIAGPDKGRSRRVDIWSFGCVLFESIIWLFFGSDVLDAFLRAPKPFGSIYWTMNSIQDKTVKLSELIVFWIDQLLEQDPECKFSRKRSALRDLISLIKTKLLVIRIPDNATLGGDIGCRIDSQALVKELDRIIENGNKTPEYLFSGYKRSDVKAPQILRAITSKSNINKPKEENSFLPDRGFLSPTAIGKSPEHGLRHDSYRHDFDDKWHYKEDDVFASEVLQLHDVDVNLLLPKKSSVLCKRCRLLGWDAPDLTFSDSLEDLRRKGRKEGCELCAMLLRVTERISKKSWVQFDKVESGLRMDERTGLPALIIRRLPGANKKGFDAFANIQIGFPRISKGGSVAHLSILRAWLKDCDKHKGCQTTRPNVLPTRVIDIGSETSPCLRLINTSSLTDGERLRYIALSHPWGIASRHRHFITTKQNVQAHMKEIPDALPRTLADAVTVTRHLGVRYLWIDTLCIIQGPGGDFAQESDRMETVYSSAYCVLAATSAEGSSSGFLKRSSLIEIGAKEEANTTNHDYVSIPIQGSGNIPEGHIIISEPVDYFEEDVLKGPLNKRGWVFQERALARRTIHFSSNQTYWECGEGIRCETLTKMYNTRVGFLGDPNFPTYGLHGSKGGDIMFYEDLYEQYSKLSFTNINDRPFAINGLEQRLLKALKEKGVSSQGYWGIFDRYWGRGLLWQRAEDTPKMTRLTRGPSDGPPAPSWSWEGHDGGITFMKPEAYSIDWLSEVILPWKHNQDQAQMTTASRMTTASYHGLTCLRGIARDLISGTDLNKQNVIFDDHEASKLRGPFKVMIIGRMKLGSLRPEQARNYVLVLAKKIGAPANLYERVAAGYVHGSLIVFDDLIPNSALVE